MVIIIDSQKPQESVTDIILATKLDPEILLNAMVDGLNNGIITTKDAIAATLAGILLQEKQSEDIGLILPTTAIFERTMRAKIPISTIPPNSLLGLRAKIEESSNDPLIQAQFGVTLGDSAILVHAGFVGSRKMGDNRQTQHYAETMASIGYGTAIEHFRSHPNSTTSADALAVTLNNFTRISDLLRKATTQKLQIPNYN